MKNKAVLDQYAQISSSIAEKMKQLLLYVKTGADSEESHRSNM